MRRGVYPAAVTPLDEKGQLDLPGLARLLAWFRSHGCEGVVLAGTNGEGPSLAAVEKRDLVRAAVPLAEGMEIILGVATPSLEEAVWSCNQAQKAGAAAALVMPPAYFRDAPEAGIEAWFRAVMDRTSLPILLYNFPKRTGIPLSPGLVERLCGHERMLGLKDSSGERVNLQIYRQAVRDDQLLYVGDETLILEALDAGWTGTISGAANVVPDWLRQVVHGFGSERTSAEVKFELIKPALQALRKSPQPATSKAVLHRLGVLPTAMPRLPVLPVEDAVTEAVMAGLSGLRQVTR